LSVDIVSLVYAADTTQLDKAEAAFQRVTAAVERNEAAARGQLTATERAGVTFGRAGQGASQFAASMGAVERANVQAARSMAEADRSASQALTLRMRLTRQQAQEEAGRCTLGGGLRQQGRHHREGAEPGRGRRRHARTADQDPGWRLCGRSNLG
jgi:hypothetical protein